MTISNSSYGMTQFLNATRWPARTDAEIISLLAEALRSQAQLAEDIPCDMDCDLLECPSCSKAIHATYFQGERIIGVMGDCEALASALLPVVRELGA